MRNTYNTVNQTGLSERLVSERVDVITFIDRKSTNEKIFLRIFLGEFSIKRMIITA